MGPLTPVLTVVCNVFNDADRLPRAVASALAGWNGPDIEIVMVDDGSTDDTGQVAENLAAADERLRVIHRDRNDGAPGAARNLGLDAARGEWVAFVDSDDEYLPGTLRRLLDRALELDADVAAGSVARYNERTDQVTPLPATRYTGSTLGPLAADSPLWHDTVAVAKVIRLSLVRSSDIRFPEGILYEDQPFTVALWLAAGRIATLDEVVYHWFVNNIEGAESITARRHSISNFHDRLEANRAIDVLLQRHPHLEASKLEKFVAHDLSLYGKDLDRRDDVYRQDFVASARRYLASLPAQHRRALAQPLRLVVGELAHGSVDGAVAACLFAYRRLHLSRTLDRRDGGWWWPYRAGDSPEINLTELVAAQHRQGRSLTTVVATDVAWVGERLAVTVQVTDGDGKLRPWSTAHFRLVGRSIGTVVSSTAVRMGTRRRFVVLLEAPSDSGASLGPLDLKFSISGLLRNPLRRAMAPVEVGPTVALPRVPWGGVGTDLQTYRTRNGNLSGTVSRSGTS